MKDKKAYFTSWGTYLAVLLAFLVALNWLVSQFDRRIDLTEAGVFAVSDEMRQILGSLKDKIQVKYYVSEEMPTGYHNLRRDTIDLLQEYARFSDGKLEIEVIDPDRIIAEYVEKNKTEGAAPAEEFDRFNPFSQGPMSPKEEKENELAQEGVPRLQGRVVGNDKFEIINFFSSIVVQYLDRKEPISVHSKVAELQYELASRIVKLSTTKKPKIAFFHGRPEDVEEIQREGFPPGMPPMKQSAYQPVIDGVLGEFFEIENVALAEESLIPADAALLIIAEPNNLNDRQVYEIDRWISSGRPALIFAARQSANTNSPRIPITPLNPRLDLLFEKWGIKLHDQFVASELCGSIMLPRRIRELGIDVMQPVPFPPCVAATGRGLNQESALSKGLEVIVFPFASRLTYDESRVLAAGLSVSVLARSDEKSWLNGWGPELSQPMMRAPEARSQSLYAGKIDLAYLIEGTFPFAHKVGDPVPPWPKKDDAKKAESGANGGETGVQAEATTQPAAPVETIPAIQSQPGKVLLCASADIIKLHFLKFGREYEGAAEFLRNAVEPMAYGQGLTNIRSRAQEIRPLDDLSVTERNMIAWGNIIGVPLVVFVLGIAYYFMRRAAAARYEQHYLDSAAAQKGGTR